jgi:hypothetical protein
MDGKGDVRRCGEEEREKSGKTKSPGAVQIVVEGAAGVRVKELDQVGKRKKEATTVAVTRNGIKPIDGTGLSSVHIQPTKIQARRENCC